MNRFSWLLVPLYFVGWLGTAGAINASNRAEFHKLDESKYHARSDWAFAMLWSAFPPAWVIAPFVTGGYADGWTLESKPFPCTEEYKNIWCKGNY